MGQVYFSELFFTDFSCAAKANPGASISGRESNPLPITSDSIKFDSLGMCHSFIINRPQSYEGLHVPLLEVAELWLGVHAIQQ